MVLQSHYLLIQRYELMKVDGKDYYPQIFLEVKDLRSGHKTGIVMEDIKFDQGFKEAYFLIGFLFLPCRSGVQNPVKPDFQGSLKQKNQ